MSQINKIPFAGQLIGQGYNSATGEAVGTALEVDSVFEDSSTDAQTADTLFETASTQESMLQTLGVSASLDVRVGLFTAGAKMSFSEEHAVNSFSSYIGGRTFIGNAIRHGKGFRLTADAQALLAAGKMDEFKTAFGDSFVRSLGTGGEFCIIARITSVSSEQQTLLTASLHASYNGLAVSGDFDAALKVANTKTQSQTDVSVKMFQTGGQGADLAFTGPKAADIIERFRQLPAFVHQHAGGLEVEIASYDTIPITVPTVEQHEDREIVLRDCAKQKTELLKGIADIQLALEDIAPVLFANLPPKDERVRLLGLYRDALNGLMAHAIRVSTGRMDPPQLFVASPAPPALPFQLKPFSPPPSLPPSHQLAALAISFPGSTPDLG